MQGTISLFCDESAVKLQPTVNCLSVLANDGACTTRSNTARRLLPCDAWGICRGIYSSVRLSHDGILCKRLHMSSKYFHRRVIPQFQFFHTERDGNSPTRTLLMRASNSRGMIKSRFSINISLYLGIDARQIIEQLWKANRKLHPNFRMVHDQIEPL